MSLTLKVVERPYTVTFEHGVSFPLTSGDAQRMLDMWPVVQASPDHADIATNYDGRVTITPATVGGGPSFILDTYTN